MKGLLIDIFSGCGGASTGVEAALGRPIDYAINHWDVALSVHAANHPQTRHIPSDVWDVDPYLVTRGRPVYLLWASPDCTHHSRAKGGKPRSQKLRALAHVVTQWARAVSPKFIFVENVVEFQDWGPLDDEGQPIKARAGETFKRWCAELELLGYSVDFRVLDASEYGAPTKRKRLFVVARHDGEPAVWPEPTHGPGLLPVRTAAECIDFSLPCPSIFERKKPLAEKTLWRVAQGIKRYVLDDPAPFIIGVGGRAGQSPPTPTWSPVGTITAKNDRALVCPTLIQTGYGERKGQKPRFLDLHEPMGTLVAGGVKHALVSALMVKHYGGMIGFHPGRAPTSTITAKDHHGLAAVTLAKFRGTHPSQPGSCDVREPLPTISAGGIHVAEVRAMLERHDVPGPHVIEVDGNLYAIADIGLRMLQPHELLRAQFGEFADGFDLSAARTKTAEVRLIGNSVPPHLARALVEANTRAKAMAA